MTIPNKVYYCPLHNTVKGKPQECPWYRDKGKCLVIEKGRDIPIVFDRCSAIELITVSKEIEAALILEISSMLERYDNADPPMNRTKFAVALIEKVRGL